MTTLQNILNNIKTFASHTCQEDSPYNKQVTQGQQAKILVIGCCDSLVDPTTLMGTELGEAFVHRNIAGLVPPCELDDNDHYHGTSAALEFATLGLQVEHIILLGHGNCGGIRFLRTQDILLQKEKSFLARWMMIANKAKEQLPSLDPEQQKPLEMEALKISFQNLLTFPWLQKRVESGSLQLHAWHFDRGVLHIYHPETGMFNLA